RIDRAALAAARMRGAIPGDEGPVAPVVSVRAVDGRHPGRPPGGPPHHQLARPRGITPTFAVRSGHVPISAGITRTSRWRSDNDRLIIGRSRRLTVMVYCCTNTRVQNVPVVR